MTKKKQPRVLILDIETKPLTAYVWGLFDQNVALNQIRTDWSVLSWSAKWLDEKRVMYEDMRGRKNLDNDKVILKSIWKLLDEADVIITQNGKRFDIKKLNARFAIHGMQPPSSFRHIDTLQIAKKHFAFTSNKLEYMSSKLCTKYKKLTKRKYSGFDLWWGCMEDDPEAWKEMERYNKRDVLTLEELYYKLIPWDSTIDFSIYQGDGLPKCSCGSRDFRKRGFFFTNVAKYQRYKCKKCGKEMRSRKAIKHSGVK